MFANIKKESVLTPIFVIIESIIEVIIPTLVAFLIDYGIQAKDMSYIWKIGFMLLFCSAISLILGILAGRSAAIASAGFAKNLRHDVYYHIQNFSFTNIDKISTSSIITRLTTDINNVQNAYMMIIRTCSS